MSRTEITQESLQRLPLAMKTEHRWMVFKITAEGAKMPISPVTGKAGSSTNSEHWVSLDEAITFLKTKESAWDGDGGLAFALGNGFVGLDIDHCFHGDEVVSEGAQAALDTLGNTGYAERSVSGDGLHVIWCNTAKPEGYVCKRALDNGAEIELYGNGRYFTVSLDSAEFGTRDHYDNPQGVIRDLCEMYFKKGRPSNDVPRARVQVTRTNDRQLENYINSVIANTNWGAGNRNHACFKAAGCIANKVDRDPGRVLEIMRGINAMHVTPPLDDSELQAVVNSALSNGTAPVENAFTPQRSEEFIPDDEIKAQFATEGVDNYVREAPLKAVYQYLLEKEMGFLGSYLRHLRSINGAKTNPMMDLAGALSCLGTLLSGRVQLKSAKYVTHPNMMIACLGPTGIGKDSYQRLNAKVLEFAGLSERVGPDNISSGEGIASACQHAGKGVCFFLDEFGNKLGDSSQKRSAFTDSIVQNLKTSYTRSDTTWKPNARSDRALNIELHQTLVNYLFTDTPGSWWSSFRRESTGDGLLGRMMVFEGDYLESKETKEEFLARRRAELQSGGERKSLSGELSDELKDNIRQWFTMTPDEAILAKAGMCEQPMATFTCNFEVDLMFEEFEYEIGQRSARNADEFTPLWNRSTAKVTKLALLFAASEHGVGSTEVTESNMELALMLTKGEVRNTVHLTMTKMADTEQRRIMLNIESVLGRKSNEKGLAIGSFNNKGIKWANDHVHKNALDLLCQEGRIYPVLNEKSGKTKYVHRRYHQED